MALPEIEEVVALVGGGEAIGPFQRPPMRLGGGHVVEYLDPRDTAVDAAGKDRLSVVRERRATTFMGVASANFVRRLVTGSQTFLNKALEYSANFARGPRNLAGLKKTIIRSGLETLYFSGMHHLMRPLVGGVGAILTLHHVRPPRIDAFQPNRLLEITPVFLERLLRRLSRSRIDVISLDEMHRRFITGEFKRRFVCITFDDGYKDLMRWAYPLLKKYKLPFALYIPTSFPDRLGELWWVALEAVIAQNSRIGMVINGKDQFFECGIVREKRELYDAIYGYLRSMKTEDELRRIGARPVRAATASTSPRSAAICA